MSKLLLFLILIFLLYRYRNSNIISKITGQPLSQIPEIITQDWYFYWRDYLNNIKEHNYDNYFNIMKSLKHFHQIYNQIYTGIDMPKQHLDNLSILQKEILNILQSTIYKLPTTPHEYYENKINKQINHLQKELDGRMTQLTQFINQDWNSGQINRLSAPVHPNELTSLPIDYSPNYSFF